MKMTEDLGKIFFQVDLILVFFFMASVAWDWRWRLRRLEHDHSLELVDLRTIIPTTLPRHSYETVIKGQVSNIKKKMILGECETDIIPIHLVKNDRIASS